MAKLADKMYLKRLLETPSVTGMESLVASLVRERLAECADVIETDVMGSVHARLLGNGSAPSVMIAAHMDEVGLMVKSIDSQGFLRVVPVGGVDAAILPGLRVDVHTSQGILRGVVGRKPIHLIESDERTKVTPISGLFIDLGLPPRKVRETVRVGDVITYGVGFEKYGKGMAVSRAFDDKAGVYVITRVMEELKRADGSLGDYICAATVQEEIGSRGANTSAFSIKPDVAIALDVTHATDYPGIDTDKYGSVSCGKGPVIARGPNINPVVFERLCAAAEAEGIMAEHGVSSLPVVDSNYQVVGFISDGDIMGAIAQHRAHTIFTGGEASMLYFDDQSLEQRMDGLKNRSVMEFATRKVVCARPDQSIARVAALLSKKKFKKLPVVDDKGTLVGVIRRSAITKYLFNLIFK